MINKRDCVLCRSTGYSSKGTFVEFGEREGWIDNVFLPKGTSALCSVTWLKKNGFAFLSLDSVLYQ